MKNYGAYVDTTAEQVRACVVLIISAVLGYVSYRDGDVEITVFSAVLFVLSIWMIFICRWLLRVRKEREQYEKRHF